MSDDPWDHPSTKAWVKHVLSDLGPKIEGSACTVSIVPRSGTDVKFAVELGFSIMYDKPIILAVFPGTQVPDHLRRVADEIVEMSPDDPTTGPRMQAAIARAVVIPDQNPAMEDRTGMEGPDWT